MLNINKKLDYFVLGVSLVKIAKIVHLPNKKWRVVSLKGKNLGTYDTKEEAVKRLRQVEFFKHKKSEAEITSTYTEIARDLNKDPDELKEFQIIFKKNFDTSYLNGDDEPEISALNKTMEELEKKKLNKFAGATQLGSPEIAGKYLADLIKILMTRISPKNRDRSLKNLKNKIYYMNEYEIANKKMPSSAALGQSIVFLKHMLFENNPSYVRAILNQVVRHL